jgi:hypothetical protein
MPNMKMSCNENSNQCTATYLQYTMNDKIKYIHVGGILRWKEREREKGGAAF